MKRRNFEIKSRTFIHQRRRFMIQSYIYELKPQNHNNKQNAIAIFRQNIGTVREKKTSTFWNTTSTVWVATTKFRDAFNSLPQNVYTPTILHCLALPNVKTDLARWYHKTRIIESFSSFKYALEQHYSEQHVRVQRNPSKVAHRKRSLCKFIAYKLFTCTVSRQFVSQVREFLLRREHFIKTW